MGVLKKISWVALSEIVGRGAIISGNIYLARIIGPENFGLFILSLVVVQYAWVGVDAGVSMYGIREVAKAKDNYELIDTLLSMRITFGFIAYIVLLAVTAILPIDSDLAVLLKISGLYLIIYSFYPEWIFRGKELFQYLSIGSFIIALVFISGLILYVNNEEDVENGLKIWLASYALGSASMLYILNKSTTYNFRFNCNITKWMTSLKESIYFSITGLLVLIYHSSFFFIVSIYLSNNELGLFSAPFRLILSLGAAGYIVISVFYPVFSKLASVNREKTEAKKQELLTYMILLGLIIGFIGNVFSQQIIFQLYGDSYADSALVLEILVWMPLLYFIRNTYGSVLMASGLQKTYNIAYSLGITTSIILCFMLIPDYGVIGASFAVVISEIITLLTTYYLYKRFI